MKIIAFGDVHKTAVPPRSRKANYNQCINVKLQEISSFISDNGVDVALIGGDWNHSQELERNPYWLTGESVGLLRRMNCVKIAALGNHDWDEVPERFPYFPLFYIYKLAEVKFSIQSGQIAQWTEGEWVSNNLPDVEFAVINSNDGDSADEAWDAMNKRRWTSEKSIHVVCYHGPIVPPQFNKVYPAAFLEKSVPMEALDGIADYVFYSDIHDPHGVNESKSSTFVNFGSIARNSAKELHNERPVQFAYFDTEQPDDGVRSVELENVIPAVDAFRSLEILEENDKTAEINDFVDNLNKTNFQMLTPQILIERLEGDTSLNTVEKDIGRKILNKLVL